MTEPNLDMDSFPCILENPSDFRKGSGDYGVTLAVQVKHVDQIQPLMAKAQKPFAAFLVQFDTIEQVETFIRNQSSGSRVQGSGMLGLDSPVPGPRPPDPGPSGIVDLDTVALALAVDPRTVQNYADAGMLVRRTTGQYDLLASLAAMNKARKDAETSQGDALRSEKLLSMQINRQRREADLQEHLGQLVNRDLVKKAFEKVLALVRQRFVMMPKYMAPRLDGLPAKEQEPLLEDYARESLAALTAPDLGTTDSETRGQGDAERSEAKSEKQGVSRKARKGRKEGKKRKDRR